MTDERRPHEVAEESHSAEERDGGGRRHRLRPVRLRIEDRDKPGDSEACDGEARRCREMQGESFESQPGRKKSEAEPPRHEHAVDVEDAAGGEARDERIGDEAPCGHQSHHGAESPLYATGRREEGLAVEDADPVGDRALASHDDERGESEPDERAVGTMPAALFLRLYRSGIVGRQSAHHGDMDQDGDRERDEEADLDRDGRRGRGESDQSRDEARGAEDAVERTHDRTPRMPLDDSRHRVDADVEQVAGCGEERYDQAPDGYRRREHEREGESENSAEVGR